MREKNDDDICFPGDKIPYRPASRNIIVYKNPSNGESVKRQMVQFSGES